MQTANHLKVASNNGRGDEIITLADGTRIKIVPVSAALLESVNRSIPNPIPPTYHDEATDRDIPNPAHPDYLAALREVDQKRNEAAVDALVMFGIELVDGAPSSDGWLNKLRYFEQRLGHDIGLENFNPDDAMDREYLYKRLILANGDIIERVTRASGLSAEDVKAAEDSFRGK